MLFLAQAAAQNAAQKTTALDRAKDVPVMFWVQCVAVVVGIIVAVALLKIIVPAIGRANKIVLTLVLTAAFAIVGMKWVYQRDEPAILTPLVEPVANFAIGLGLPSKPKETNATPPPPPKTPPSGPTAIPGVKPANSQKK